MTDLTQRVIDENQKAVAIAKDLHELCDALVGVKLFYVKAEGTKVSISDFAKVKLLARELRNKHIVYADTD